MRRWQSGHFEVATSGAGLYVDGTEVELAVSSNWADSHGGGIYLTPSSTTRLANATVAHNHTTPSATY